MGLIADRCDRLEECLKVIEKALRGAAAENLRMREALKKISELGDVRADEAMQIARQALELVTQS